MNGREAWISLGKRAGHRYRVDRVHWCLVRDGKLGRAGNDGGRRENGGWGQGSHARSVSQRVGWERGHTVLCRLGGSSVIEERGTSAQDAMFGRICTAACNMSPMRAHQSLGVQNNGRGPQPATNRRPAYPLIMQEGARASHLRFGRALGYTRHRDGTLVRKGCFLGGRGGAGIIAVATSHCLLQHCWLGGAPEFFQILRAPHGVMSFLPSSKQLGL